MAICLNAQLDFQECKNFGFGLYSLYNVDRLWLEKSCVAYRLLSSPTCPVLDALGKKLSFEIAVGLNGRVWVYNHPSFPLSYFFFLFLCLSMLAISTWLWVLGWTYEHPPFLCLFKFLFLSKMFFFHKWENSDFY